MTGGSMAGKSSGRTANALVTASGVFCLSLASAVVFVLVADWAAGAYLQKTTGLNWPPYSVIRHRTEEFQYESRINNLGFRDRDFPIRSRGGLRLVALGDSFTYGWGVQNSEPWPKVLERSLLAAGRSVEVLNLGQPGAGPRQYADLAARAVALLRPDVVIVGFLQSDDIMQAGTDTTPETIVTLKASLQATLQNTLPHLTQLFAASENAKLDISAEQLAGMWEKQVTDFIPQMAPPEKATFDRLPAHIRSAYLHGLLNPGLLFYSLRHARFLIDSCDLQSAGTQQAMQKAAEQLARIRVVCEKYGAKLIVLSIPHPGNTSAEVLASMGQLGFATHPDLLTSDAPDRAIAEVCRLADLPLLSVTTEFRNAAAREDLYYHLDSHFNAAGHAVYGDLIARLILDRLASPH